MLFRSVRQDAALREVHKLTFEHVFYNLREGLFIIRKDFDRLVKVAEEKEKLSAHDWSDLTVAFKQGQSIFEEIPDFYDDYHRLYMIDRKREELLQEAALRTLHRVDTLLVALHDHKVDFLNHSEACFELQ